MKIVGFKIDAKILTIYGRIDAVVKTEKEIYILEFKINQSAEEAIKHFVYWIQENDFKYTIKHFRFKDELSENLAESTVGISTKSKKNNTAGFR